jgi:hypothetical protein
MKKQKRIIVVAVVAVALIAVIATCSVRFVFGSKHRITTVDLGNDHFVRIWTEYPSWSDWDPDIAYPAIYYEITQYDKAVVPKTWLGLDFGYTYDIETAFAEDGALACVYDATLWGKGLFIIFDATSGESWPRLSEYEVSYTPAVRRKWVDRYNRLMLENPSLPRYFAE